MNNSTVEQLKAIQIAIFLDLGDYFISKIIYKKF